jgi:hypothetical protein
LSSGPSTPRQNLPAAVARKRGESNFVAAFQRGFTAEREGQGVGGRHFEMAGYGIADFVWMDFGQSGKRAGGTTGEPVLTAFEMKLKNWRRAISQAYRYSYFSDRAIVVLPHATADKAEEQLHVFQRLGIGLWSYEPKSMKIDMRFTPVATKAKNAIAHEKALNRFSRKLKFRKACE